MAFKPTNSHRDVRKRVGCVLGIEPNEHQIPRFQGKYSYHTDHSENPERPNSPNVLPMSRVMLGGFFVSVNFIVPVGIGENGGIVFMIL